MSDTQSKIGKYVEEGEKRDAIHVAVVPVVAAENLAPGERVVFVQRGNTERVGKAKHGEGIGIIDPFLRSAVYQGRRVWMFLLPNTITSLRHDWTHPAFGDVGPAVESQAWIEAFAAEMDQTYGRLMGAAERWVNSEENGWDDGYTRDDTEAYKRVDHAKWPLFWHHYEIVTGTKVKDHEATFFTCSC